MSLIFFGRIAQAILMLISLRVMTTILSPEEVGRWALLVSAIAFFVLGLVSPIGLFINRRLHHWVEEGKVKSYFNHYIGYLFVVSLLASLALYTFNFYHVVIPEMSVAWVVGLLMASIIVATLNQTYIPSLNLLGYRGFFIGLSLATVVLSLASSFLLVSKLSPSAEMWQAGQLLGQFFLAVIGGFVFFYFAAQQQKNVSSVEELRITKKKINVIFSFSWPLVIAVLFTWVQSQSYRFVVQEMIGLQALGLFVIGYGLAASLISVFEAIVTTYFAPIFYKRITHGDADEQALAWHDYATAILPSLLVIVAVLYSVSDELAYVLLDIKFSQAAQYIVWGAFAEVFRVAVSTYALLAHAGMNTKKLIFPNALAAISAPCLIFIFVPLWGIHGVGLGLLVAGLVAMFASHLFLSQSFKILMPWKEIFCSVWIMISMVILFYAIHAVIGESNGFFTSLVWLLCSGVLLLGVLFMMLKEHLNRKVF